MDNPVAAGQPRAFELEERVRLLLDSVINYIYPLVSGLVGLFLVPVILRFLGAEAYGLWIAALSVAGVAGFLDMGLSYSLTREIAGARTAEDRSQIASFVVTSGNIYLGLGMAGALLIATLGLRFSGMLHLSPGNLAVAHEVFALVGVGFFTEHVVWFTTVVFHGLRRFDVANLVGVLYVVLRAGGILVVLAAGGGLRAVVGWQAAASALTALVGLVLVRQLQPQFRLQVGRFDWRALRPHLSFGLTTLITATVSGLVVQTASILIGFVRGSAAVALFYVGQRFPLAVSVILWRGAETVFPAASEAGQTPDLARLREVLDVVTRWMIVLALPPCMLLWVLAPDLLRAWIGHADPETIWVLRLTSAAVLADVVGAGAMQVVLAAGAARAVLAIVASVAAANLGLTLWLLLRLGVVGATGGYLVTNSLSTLILLWFATGKYELRIFRLMRSSLEGLFLPALACLVLASLVLTIRFTHPWAKVILASLAGGVGYAVLLYLQETREEERVLAGKVLQLPAAILRPAYRFLRRHLQTPSYTVLGGRQPETPGLPSRPRLWDEFRQTRLWRALRGINWMRGAVYFTVEIWSLASESLWNWQLGFDEFFLRRPDPWNYTASPVEQERIRHRLECLDALRRIQPLGCALEIGCAEGIFTERLASRCASLLAVDLSPVALERARMHCAGSSNVRFARCDLKQHKLHGTFDLIVITAVLEYVRYPTALRKVRAKLVEALRPGGHLLVESTRANPIVENSWWGRKLIRGKWINAFVAQHPAVRVVFESTTDWYAITILERVA